MTGHAMPPTPGAGMPSAPGAGVRRSETAWAALLIALAAATPAPALAEDAPPPGASACTGCHGAGPEAAYPIGHLSAAEIAAALAAFRGGERAATLMDRIAAGFTPAESEAIAAWFGRRE